MKVNIHYIPNHQEENAILNLHGNNEQLEEIKTYLERNGIMNHIIIVREEACRWF